MWWVVRALTTMCAKGDMGHYYYGPGHPMKPHRLKLTHHLILSYNLYRRLEVYVRRAAALDVAWCVGG